MLPFVSHPPGQCVGSFGMASELLRNFEIQMGRPAYLMVEEAGPPGMPPAKTFRPSYYLESDDGKAEVTVVCKQYLDHVERLVQDFLTAHQ
jgi:hypothetical protein